MPEIQNAEYVVLDVETTGLSPQEGDRIVEIAALKLKGLNSAEDYHSLVNPEREISWGAFQVHGITPGMLMKAPRAREILPEVLRFIGNSILVGHNISFDLGFLLMELNLAGLNPPHDFGSLDTLRIARGLLPELGQYPLWLVAHALGVDTPQEHRAMADVRLTAAVFLKLMEVAQRKDIHTIEHLQQLFSYPPESDSPRMLEIKSIVEEAIDRERPLQMLYFGVQAASSSSRMVTPKKIIEERGKKSLVGYCHLRRDERQFRLDRILDIAIVE